MKRPSCSFVVALLLFGATSCGPPAKETKVYQLNLRYQADQTFAPEDADTGKPLNSQPILLAPGDAVEVEVLGSAQQWEIERWTAQYGYKQQIKGGKHPEFDVGPMEQYLPISGTLGQQIKLTAALRGGGEPDTELKLAGPPVQAKVFRGCQFILAGEAQGITSAEADNRLLQQVNKPEPHRVGDPPRQSFPNFNKVWYVVKVTVTH